ncbi:hypothetical protein RSO01_47940 [Reyranella soli]|uniref:DUF302 domain-containing protein n=2 Tax=Reyranella soli TaxID=1230389 RepID=A0A512NFA2_9HYPH|nr:hypothetical protein RSO01_47940 [Reyranella soli]
MVMQIQRPSTMKLGDHQSTQTNPNSAALIGSIIQRKAILVEHLRIDSNRRYDEVQAALAALPQFDNRIRGLLRDGEIDRVRSELRATQGAAHLVVFSIATHGDWLQIVSGKRKAAQYVIGNVLVSTQMTRHRLAAGLYAPLRVMLYENDEGTATIEYDRPSTLFGQYGDERVTAVAKELDRQIYDVLIHAAG